MGRPDTILIVDDEGEIVRLIAEVLADEGYTVRTAQDGPSAMREVVADPPALLLLDYWMPGMTGADVLQELRTSGFEQLPVVLMSAGTRGDLAQRSGATAFLSKPFDINALVACVADFLQPTSSRTTVS